MMNRSGFSFVAMLVINPIVILFYQNCSFTPISQAARENPPEIVRKISSVEMNQKPKTFCANSKVYCPIASIE